MDKDRLGFDICSPHVCIIYVVHRLTKKVTTSRRIELNDQTSFTVSRNPVTEPTGLVRDDGKRVDGMSLIPWSKGSTLIWDGRHMHRHISTKQHTL